MNQADFGLADILEENIPARKDWDHHAGYGWTFFPESEKERVAHWLHREGVQGASNADIGGGWYIHVPGSVVMDISSVSLEKNPSLEKILFDLDTIGPDNKLPLRSRSLETVTMVSVWQYLNKPEAILEDLKRVLVPGGNVYIINQDGAGLSEHQKQHNHGEGIMWQIHEFGYDGELIQLPVGKSSHLYHWHAVKVTMPQTQHELFPVEREYSVKINRLLDDNADLYREDREQEYNEARLNLANSHAQAEHTKVQYLQTMLHTYPVTQASGELVQKAIQEAQTLSKNENAPVLLWSEAPKIFIDMYQENDATRIEMCAYTPSNAKGGSVSWSGKGSVCGIHTAGHRIIGLLTDIENRTLLRKMDKDALRELLRFVHYHALNDFTRKKQELVRKFLRLEYVEFLRERDRYKEKYLQKLGEDEMPTLERELKVAEYTSIFLPHRQERKAETFLDRKREAEKGNIPVIGTGTLSPLSEEEKTAFLGRIVSRSC